MITVPSTWDQLAEDAPNPRWARQGLARLRESAADLDGLDLPSRQRLSTVLGSSPVLASWVVRDRALLALVEADDLSVERTRGDYASALGSAEEDPAEFFSHLRRVRRRELFRIAAREALALAPVEVTAREVSAFAEAAVEAAMTWALARLVVRYGEPVGAEGAANLPCALGMGKLGGGELNLSSDVDLIFLYRTAKGGTRGGTDGSLAPPAFYAKFVALVAEALGRVTDDGLVFRVDLDLRPEGRNGEPAQAEENAVLYYQSWGQTWERAVLLKARPVAGDLPLGDRFLEEVTPFIFRRSLDYTTVEDFKEMKRKIDQDAGRRLAGDDDLKLGRGGIREVEFLVQTLQLIHAGKAPELRGKNTLDVLDRLGRSGLLDESTSQGVARCYRFLRTVEHAVQAFQFRQTHRLPRVPEELLAIGRRLGFGREGDPTAEFLSALDDVRAEVHEAYGRLFHGASRAWEAEDPQIREAGLLVAQDPVDPGVSERLRTLGFRAPMRVAEALRFLREGPPKADPSRRALRILERVGPFLLVTAARSPDPDRALIRLGEFLVASGARASYLSLLEENPSTAKLLLSLFGTSDFLSRYLTAHPELLDELVLDTGAVRDKSRSELSAELREGIARAADDEERLDALRRFRNAEFLRIALQDLAGALGPEDVGRQLALVAEVCLEAAFRQSSERLAEKYGEPVERTGRPARFSVLGLGKLGGREIDYHSDLDVLFLYSAPGTSSGSAGRVGLANSEFYARLAQRIIGALGSRTREGVAFRMDARLRPSGQAGPLVTSLEAFQAYHREGSQTWERLALTKLRPVAGDFELGREALEAVTQILYGAEPEADPRPEIARMRARVESEVGREGETRIDLKAGRGGIVDVEFAVQTLQLLHGWRRPAARSPNTMEALAALKDLGILDDREGSTLAEGYAFLRRVEAKLRILLDRPTDALPADPARLGELARGLGYKGAEDDATVAFTQDLVRCREAVRGAFQRIFGEA